jgi:hypothetical protein
MAAGLGFKDFVTGEVLTAADVDGYLMQGVWVFASAAARDAAVTSPQEGNFAYLKDTNVTTYYTGSSWANLDTTGMTNPMTTTGDTIYSSSGSTPARLGIGSTGNVLTVAGGVPTWAAPASVASGATFISRTTFSAVSGVNVDDIFSDTYENYLVRAEFLGTSGNPSIYMQGRYSTTTVTSGYYYGFAKVGATGAIGLVQGSNDSSFFMCFDTSTSATQHSLADLNIYRRSGATANLNFTGQSWGDNSYIAMSGAGSIYSVQTYTGLRFSGSSSTISGQVTVYGLAKS